MATRDISQSIQRLPPDAFISGDPSPFFLRPFSSYDRPVILLCTVRDCAAPLVREDRRLICSNGHAFDLARSGYGNLLQPQERRSKQPGDSAEAVAARRRLHECGIARPLHEALAAMLAPAPDDVILDAGCGDGWFLGELQRAHGFTACGVDISTPAIELAAKRYPGCTWIVANADRFVPLGDGSVTKLVSITARMNVSEFRRVLRDDGALLVAVAAPDDLIELRGEGKERGAATRALFAPAFELVEHRRVTTMAKVDADLVRDLRLSIYRPRGEVNLTQVTLSLDLLRFAARPRARPAP
jgi:23S rRNA (guanine745-N1)-methyltransferase